MTDIVRDARIAIMGCRIPGPVRPDRVRSNIRCAMAPRAIAQKEKPRDMRGVSL
ncbi:hypothetical protein ACF3M1_06655 [Luteimonas sp. WGS1318]|uniref:hypothetical protein n=1 Tax=Luteimonas sp. WGS1318 TaxID=3366815 RepID=UPI00372CF229